MASRLLLALPCLASSSDAPYQHAFFFNVRTGTHYSTWTTTATDLMAVGETFQVSNDHYDSPESVTGQFSLDDLCQKMMHCADGFVEASFKYGRLLDVVPPAGALDHTEHTVVSSKRGIGGNVHCHYVQGKYACHKVDVQLFDVVTEEASGIRHSLKIACHELSQNTSMNGCHVASPGDLIFEGQKPVLV